MRSLVRLDGLVNDRDLYAVLEGENPTGSIKDRFALHAIQAAEHQGRLNPGMTIIETSAGNTAIALAHIAQRREYACEFLLPDTIDKNLLSRVQAYDSTIHLCPANDPIAPLEIITEKCEKGGYFWPMQYFHPDAPASYHSLAQDIRQHIKRINAISCCVGTGATLRGLSDVLKEAHPEMERIAVCAGEGSIIPGLRPAGARLSYLSYTDLFDPDIADHSVPANEDEARQGVRILHQYGIDAGLSSGASLYAMLVHLKASRIGSCGVAILADAKHTSARK